MSKKGKTEAEIRPSGTATATEEEIMNGMRGNGRVETATKERISGGAMRGRMRVTGATISTDTGMTGGTNASAREKKDACQIVGSGTELSVVLVRARGKGGSARFARAIPNSESQGRTTKIKPAVFD
jgi:hypothetical protein